MTSQTPHTMIKLLSNDDKIAFMSLYNVLCHVCICLPIILIGYTCSCAVNKILFYSILFYSVKSPTHEKINCNRGTTLDQSIVKLLGFKPVLLAQNLTLNSGTAPSYKNYIFGPIRNPYKNKARNRIKQHNQIQCSRVHN